MAFALLMLGPLLIAGLLTAQAIATLRTMPPAGHAWRVCARCEYNLSGLPLSAACPECGSSAVIEPRPGARGGQALASVDQVRAMQVLPPLLTGGLIALEVWALGDPWGWLMLPLIVACCLPQVVALPALARRVPLSTALMHVLLLHGALAALVHVPLSLSLQRGAPAFLPPAISLQVARLVVVLLPLSAGVCWLMAEYHSWSRWLEWKQRSKKPPS